MIFFWWIRVQGWTRRICKGYFRSLVSWNYWRFNHPPTLKTEKKYERTKVLTSTFGIDLKQFIFNAEPLKDATSLIIETNEGEHSIPFEELDSLLLKFSHKGKPLKEDGPVHVLKKTVLILIIQSNLSKHSA